MTVYTVFFK